MHCKSFFLVHYHFYSCGKKGVREINSLIRSPSRVGIHISLGRSLLRSGALVKAVRGIISFPFLTQEQCTASVQESSCHNQTLQSLRSAIIFIFRNCCRWSSEYDEKHSVYLSFHTEVEKKSFLLERFQVPSRVRTQTGLEQILKYYIF